MRGDNVYKYQMFRRVRREDPWIDTGEIVAARRSTTAKKFYRVLKGIDPYERNHKLLAKRLPKIKGVKPDGPTIRAWMRFPGLVGHIQNVSDEVRHFAANESGLTACGLQFDQWRESTGKPQCARCLAAAMEKRPEMKAFL